MTRLCIYLTYDKQKIIDRYIGYMLQELKSCVNYLVVVCNEMEIARGNEILERFADEIFYRENIGFDIGGFKEALCDFLGWERVLQYDELVLVNDSIFGPFRPMKEIFSEMDNRTIDFWGLAKHGDYKNSSGDCFPEYIQSYFFCIRSKMLHCRYFKKYWEDMPFYTVFEDVIRQFELKFTSYFANLGYGYDVLSDIEANNSKKEISNNYMQYGTISYELIRKRNFPFLKKQQIAYNTLNLQTQENLRQSIDYIDKATNYDVNMIWENIIRTLNITDLQRSLHLQYIISSSQKENRYKKIAILVFITCRQSTDYILPYLHKLKQICYVKIFSENSDYLKPYQKCGFESNKIYQDKIVELLAGFCDYNFVCVINDTDMLSNTNSNRVGNLYFYNILENLIKNRMHISGIMSCFESESHLGFLTSPQPNFEQFFGECGKGWNGKYEDVIRIKETIDLDCQISESLVPFRVTNSFWIRGCILKKVKYINAQDFSCLPYIWIYLAQDAGYYSGIVESTEYASMNEINLQQCLQQIAFQIRQQYGDFGCFNELKKRLYLSELLKYCEKYSKVLIYGAGYLAKQYKKFIPNLEAFMVSDGQTKAEEMEGLPIKYLSEIKNPYQYGIILCLNKEHQNQVITILKEHCINHYFCI